MDDESVLFEESQGFGAVWVTLMLLVFGFVGAIFGTIAITEPQKSQALLIPGIVVVVVLVAVTLLLGCARLHIAVDGRTIHVHFFPFFRRDIPLAEVASWEARTYRPIAEFGGWGIRSSWGGKNSAYNMKGDCGVQLEFTNGKRLLLGSQRAEELADAIGTAKNARN